MSRIFLRGAGAVSPAGWGRHALRAALADGAPVPGEAFRAPAGDRVFAVRRVPVPQPRPNWIAHPRLRRASRISHFALAAALEALGDVLPSDGDRRARPRLGIVAGTHAGSLRYSEQFYGEVLRDPATASPILFPETVINAPASHVAAYLDHGGPCLSLIADQTAFVKALLLAARWLAEDQVDLCLVLGMDELAWTLADALGHLAPGVPAGEGAGALLLAREPGSGPRGVELGLVTDALRFRPRDARAARARDMRRQLPGAGPRSVLVDSRCGHPRSDRPEVEAWSDWTGPRCSPRTVLGEGLCAATAWQFVQAWAELVEGRADTALVSVVGGQLEAIGATLVGRGEVPASTESGRSSLS